MLSRALLTTFIVIDVGLTTGACHDSTHAVPDGAFDGAIDADAAVIRVTVFDETAPGTPAVAARVIFQAPDRSIKTVFTGADGVAEADSPAGTTVTAIQDLLPSPGRVFTSFRELAPGMAVIAGPPVPIRRYVGSVPVSMPSLLGGMYYEIRVPCADLIHGSVDPMSVFVFAPCTGAASATLVGRVRDANHQLLGVSVLDGVDLPAAIGSGALVMPSYARTPVVLTADISNVPTTVDHTTWGIFYKQHSEDIHDRVDAAQYLETENGSAATPGNIVLQTEGYPVGNETLSVLVTHPAGYEGAFSNHVSVMPGQATHVAFDASTMIRAFDTTASTVQSAVMWSETSDGASPTLVDVAVSWGDVHGTIYAPYDGPSLTLDDLPGELLSTDAPTLVSLASYSGDGLAYRDIVVSLREYAEYWKGHWASAVPELDDFSTSVFEGSY